LSTQCFLTLGVETCVVVVVVVVVFTVRYQLCQQFCLLCHHLLLVLLLLCQHLCYHTVSWVVAQRCCWWAFEGGVGGVVVVVVVMVVVVVGVVGVFWGGVGASGRQSYTKTRQWKWQFVHKGVECVFQSAPVDVVIAQYNFIRDNEIAQPHQLHRNKHEKCRVSSNQWSYMMRIIEHNSSTNKGE
jgi:hypothetical protein